MIINSVTGLNLTQMANNYSNRDDIAVCSLLDYGLLRSAVLNLLTHVWTCLRFFSPFSFSSSFSYRYFVPFHFS